MPSSSSSNAFARRVRRVSAFPSRTSAIRSARVPGSRKPPRIIPLQESLDPAPASFFVNRWNRGIHYFPRHRASLPPDGWGTSGPPLLFGARLGNLALQRDNRDKKALANPDRRKLAAASGLVTGVFGQPEIFAPGGWDAHGQLLVHVHPHLVVVTVIYRLFSFRV